RRRGACSRGGCRAPVPRRSCASNLRGNIRDSKADHRRQTVGEWTRLRAVNCAEPDEHVREKPSGLWHRSCEIQNRTFESRSLQREFPPVKTDWHWEVCIKCKHQPAKYS